MIRTYFALILLVSSITFSSCENEIEVLGPYEENMIVYGLLNSGEAVQYIRVNKVFVNPANNAMEIAKISDSLFYDSLIVQLKNEKTQQVFELQKETGIAKDSGFFANDKNILYRYNNPIDPQATYSLIVKNPYSGKTVTGATVIVGPTSNIQAPVKDTAVALNIQTNKNIFFQFSPGKNTRVMDVQATVYYENINDADTNIRETRQLTWKIITGLLVNPSSGTQTISSQIPGDYFFQTVVSSVPVIEGIHRRLVKVDIHYYSGAEDLHTYMTINKPSLGIVQKKPEYSNVSGALGLFSSRNTVSINSVKFSADTKIRLANHPDAVKLRFLPY